eukprot:PhM_4_TR8353/c0_g1_i2/m.69587
MQLCFACLHHFPPPNLTPLNVSENAASALNALRNNINKLRQQATPAQRRLISQLEDDTRMVAICVERDLKEREQQVVMRMGAMSMSPGGLDPLTPTDHQGLVTTPRPPPQPFALDGTTARRDRDDTATMLSTTMDGNGNKDRGIDKYIAKAKARASQQQWSIANRFGFTVSSSSRRPARDTEAAANAAKVAEGLSSTMFLILESLAGVTRAEKGFLWLLTSTGEELVSPFWAGMDVRRGASPMHVNATTGVVGCVTSTGIAVNAALTDPNANSVLCVPIGTRRSDGSGVYGAIQLLNKTVADHFTESDEGVAAHAASLVAYLCGSFVDITSDLCQRVFDPSSLQQTARFRLERYQRQPKDHFSLIEAHQPTHLMYRSWVHDAALARVDIQQRSTMTLLTAGLKEVHHLIGTLESSWKASVASIEESRRRELDLGVALDKAQQELATTKAQHERMYTLSQKNGMFLYGENDDPRSLAPSPSVMTTASSNNNNHNHGNGPAPPTGIPVPSGGLRRQSGTNRRRASSKVSVSS